MTKKEEGRRGHMTGIVRKIVVRQHERALAFRRGEFPDLLGAGVHWRLDLFGTLAVERVDVSPAATRTGFQDLLVKSWSAAERERYEVVEVEPGQIAVVYLNGPPERASRAAAATQGGAGPVGVRGVR
jgi:hypothetical protein